MKYFRAAALAGAALLAGPNAIAQAPRPPQTPPISATPSLMMAHVRVADMARSERFYHDVFGMTVTNPVSAREHVLRFSTTDMSASGIILLLAGATPEPNGGFLIQVPDIDATFSRIVAAGGKITRPPSQPVAASPVRNGMLTDPDGTRIEVMQYVRR